MKNKLIVSFSIVCSFLFVVLLASAMSPSARAAGTIFVDVDSTCNSGCGGSWGNAYPNLQDALAAAQTDDEVWIAEGIYYADVGAGQVDNNRDSTFTLQNGVAIYGGFVGTESSLDQRQNPAPATVLSGDLEQNDTIDANGIVTDTTNISGNNAYHVVTGGGVTNTAVLDNLIITAGQATGSTPNHEGGGMFNDGSSPTLTYVALRGNLANGRGAGMLNVNSSSPTLTDVIFNKNRSVNGNGGGMYNAVGSAPVLTAVLFDNNQASGFAGGMGNSSSNPTLTDVIFRENSANGSGGGMANATSNPSLTAVTFISNTTNINGGGMNNMSDSNPTLTDVTFTGNEANFGGGMANGSSAPVLTAVTFMSNTATTYGSGMYNNYSDTELTDVTFYGNHSATQGGGMYNNQSSPTLTNVTFDQNSVSSYGGGLRNYGNSHPTLTNVTFSGNHADSHGGGLLNANSNPTLINVTFTGNSAISDGGGMANFNSHPTLINVIFANSTAGGDCKLFDSSTIAAGSSHNLIEDTGSAACGLTNGVDNNIIGQDPDLGPLQNNGGKTLTHALLPNSPAIDAGDDVNCPADDQRGKERPQPTGGQCDIGAYERDTMPPTIVGISRVQPELTDAASVAFVVTFSEEVMGVDTADFSVTMTGLLYGASISGLMGSGTTYTVTVGTGASGGSLRLDLIGSATVTDLSDNALADLPYISGESYTILGIKTYLPLIMH